MVGSYDLRLVALSVLISIAASYAALDLAGRVTSAQGRARTLWLSGGATAMGMGIWSMHYIGMLAFRLPVLVQYDWPTVLLSLLAAIGASGIALFVVSRPQMGLWRAIGGSVPMGAGIAAMHYIGMAAMRLPAMCVYSPGLVAMSVALAIVISFVALGLSFHFRGDTSVGGWMKTLSALVMGAAIPVMHYTGMAAATFVPVPAPGDLTHAVSISSLGMTSIVAVTSMVLALVLVTSMADRRFSLHVTGRRRAEAALRETEEQMDFALDAAGVGTWERDLTTNVGQWSARLAAFHGVESGPFPGTVEAFLAYVHPDDRAMVREGMDGAIRERRDWNIVYRTVWSDGSEHAVNEIGRAMYDEQGLPIRTAGIGMDVTERYRLEAQFRQAQKMEAIGHLAGGVAHDFNNLLTAIIGFTELALDRLEPDHAVRPDMQEVLHAGRSAATLTRQLLAFSRKQILQPQILDLNVLIGRVETLLRRTIGDDVQLVTRFEPRLARVNADPGQIEQVLMNLAINSRDAMPTGGFLTIETATLTLDAAFAKQHPGSSPGIHAMIAITDTGVGMDAATLGRVFEPFFTTKEPGKGTGLGLATIYGIVKQSSGSIWVDSDVGRGTTFKIYLPQAEHVAADSQPVVTSRPVNGTETILLVDDQQHVRAVARATLVRQGFTVLDADRGDAALQLAKRHDAPIHLLLTDVVMPGIGGRDLARLLLQERPSLRVLYMSGYTDQAIVDHGVLETDIAFIQKPFSPEGLLLKVRETLDAPR